MNPNTENVTPAGGDGGQPTPAASPQGAPTSPVDVKSFVAAFKADPEFASLIKELALPVAQSTKDRRFDKQEKRMEQFEKHLARYEELKAGGLPDTLAKRWLAMEQEQDAQPEELSPAAPTVSPGSGTQAPTLDTDTLALLGLTINDPDVVELIRQGKMANDDFIRLAKDRKARAVQPNAAAVVPTTQGISAGSGEDSLETLGRQLEAMRRLQPHQIDRAKYNELYAKYQQLAMKQP